jgi:hypothetical protein
MEVEDSSSQLRSKDVGNRGSTLLAKVEGGHYADRRRSNRWNGEREGLKREDDCFGRYGGEGVVYPVYGERGRGGESEVRRSVVVKGD